MAFNLSAKLAVQMDGMGVEGQGAEVEKECTRGREREEEVGLVQDWTHDVSWLGSSHGKSRRYDPLLVEGTGKTGRGAHLSRPSY